MKDKTLIGLGEILWDVFPDKKRAGGAPANVVFRWQELEGTGYVVSAVGDDDLGRELVEWMRGRRLSDAYVQRNSKPTGVVKVSLNAEGIPEYHIAHGSAYDALVIDPQTRKLATEVDAIVFGTLAQRKNTSRATIQSLVSECRGLVVYDINLRGWEKDTEAVVRRSLELADVLKINTDELRTLSQKLYLNAELVQEDIIQWLSEEYTLGLVALTMGEKGCLLYGDGKWARSEGIALKSHDTVGAGDAFTAAMVDKILQKAPLQEIADSANRFAASVIQKQDT